MQLAHLQLCCHLVKAALTSLNSGASTLTILLDKFYEEDEHLVKVLAQVPHPAFTK